MRKVVDRGIIEAEENALIDFQLLVQGLIMEKGISRATLAERAGISEARLSQLMGSEANPTAKTLARILFALGEEIAISIKKRPRARLTQVNEWKWEGDIHAAFDHQSRRLNASFPGRTGGRYGGCLRFPRIEAKRLRIAWLELSCSLIGRRQR